MRLFKIQVKFPIPQIADDYFLSQLLQQADYM